MSGTNESIQTACTCVSLALHSMFAACAAGEAALVSPSVVKLPVTSPFRSDFDFGLAQSSVLF